MNISRILHTLLFTIGVSVLNVAYTQTVDNPALPPTFLLLGEVHDNPNGHQQRLQDLQARIDAGWRPVIAMEQFNRERNAALQTAMQTCADAQCVIDQTGGSRWEWKFYLPVIELAMKYKLQLVAANVSRQDATLILRQGFTAALTDQDIRTFGLPESISSALRKGQEQAIINGHCGHEPDANMLAGLVNAQIARDLWMANVMMTHQDTGVVLLAGNGHVRNDLGVAYWLKYKHMENIRSVGYLESGNADADKPYDVVRLIKPHERADPCATFKIPAK